MGMHNYTTIGFAIVAKNCTLNSTTQYNRCSNKNCDNHKEKYMEDAFCPKCGSKVETYHSPIDTDPYEVIDHFEIDTEIFEHHYGEEIVGDDDTHYYFMGDLVEFDEYDGGEPKVLEIEKLLEYKTELIAKYKKEIEQIKSVYNSAEIQYVALNYWS